MALHRSLRLSASFLTLLATGCLLSACDFSETDPVPAATPANSGASGSTDTSGSYLWGVTNVINASATQADQAVTGQRITLVNGSDGSALQHILVDAASTQLAAQAFTVSVDGLSQTAGNEVQLYYTNAGKLYETGLLRNQVPTPHQVSAESQACRLLKVLPADASATVNWVLLSTAGPDGQCEASDDNEVKLVSSAASTTAAAQAVTASLSQLIDVRRDAQGKLLQLIGMDNTRHALVSVSAIDGKVSLVSNGVFTGATDPADVDNPKALYWPSVTFFSKVPGQANQAFVRVGQGLQVLNFASATPELQSTSVATLNWPESPFVHTDATSTYFADVILQSPAESDPVGLPTVRALAADGSAKLLATLSEGELLSGGVMTPANLVLIQQTSTGVALRIVNKTSGAIRQVSLPTDVDSLHIEAQNGEVLVVSQPLASGSGQAKLWRVDLSAAGVAAISPTALSGAEKARVITTVREASSTLAGEAQTTQLLWCDATTACQASNVASYALSAGLSSLQLAKAGAGASTAAWDVTNARTLSSAIGLASVATQAAAPTSNVAWAPDSLWLFDASKAASLISVTLPK
jgi:hypothetical protein